MEHNESVRAALTMMWQGMTGLFIIAAVMAGLTAAIIKFCSRAKPPSP